MTIYRILHLRRLYDRHLELSDILEIERKKNRRYEELDKLRINRTASQTFGGNNLWIPTALVVCLRDYLIKLSSQNSWCSIGSLNL